MPCWVTMQPTRNEISMMIGAPRNAICSTWLTRAGPRKLRGRRAPAGSPPPPRPGRRGPPGLVAEAAHSDPRLATGSRGWEAPRRAGWARPRDRRPRAGGSGARARRRIGRAGGQSRAGPLQHPGAERVEAGEARQVDDERAAGGQPLGGKKLRRRGLDGGAWSAVQRPARRAATPSRRRSNRDAGRIGPRVMGAVGTGRPPSFTKKSPRAGPIPRPANNSQTMGCAPQLSVARPVPRPA